MAQKVQDNFLCHRKLVLENLEFILNSNKYFSNKSCCFATVYLARIISIILVMLFSSTLFIIDYFTNLEHFCFCFEQILFSTLDFI